MLKKIFLVLLVALVVIQFIHPKKNKAEGAQPNYIGNAYTIPDDVKSILAKACIDCHSNNTKYPGSPISNLFIGGSINIL